MNVSKSSCQCPSKNNVRKNYCLLTIKTYDAAKNAVRPFVTTPEVQRKRNDLWQMQQWRDNTAESWSVNWNNVRKFDRQCERTL